MMTAKRILWLFTVFFLLSAGPGICGQKFKRFGLGTRISGVGLISSPIGDADATYDVTYMPGVNATFYINKSFSLELAVDHFSTNVDVEHDYHTGGLGELSQTPVLLTLRYQHPVFKTDVNLYLGAGIGYYFNDFSNESRDGLDPFYGLNLDVEAENSIGGHANVGIEFFIYKNLALNVDMKFIFNKSEFTLRKPGEDSETSDVALNAEVLGVGLRYYF